MPITPHDELFKATFSILSEVQAFLRNWMPPFIRQGLDYDTLKRDPDSYVDEDLKSHFSDMVYSCRWRGSGKAVKFAFLLEHKSFVPQNIHLQLLRYLLAIYNRQQNKGGRLDLVIPVVIYHGAQHWKQRRLDEYFNLPHAAFGQYIPGFSYELIDLNRVADELIIKVRPGFLLSNTFGLFKYHHRQEDFHKDFYEKLFSFTERELSQEEKVLFLTIITNYIFMAYQKKTQEIMKELQHSFSNVMPLKGTPGEAVYLQGREEGREKGREEGIEIDKMASRFEEKVKVLQKLAEKAVGAEFAAYVSSLPQDFVEAFYRHYDHGQTGRLLLAASVARRASSEADAAREIRAALLAFGLSEREATLYFEAAE